MAAQFGRNEKSFKSILDRQADQYPFFCVVLYTPGNGVNARLHKYVRSHWNILDSLTGDNCLLLAIENMKSELSIDIEKFKPEDVYKIARYLGCTGYFAHPFEDLQRRLPCLPPLLPHELDGGRNSEVLLTLQRNNLNPTG
jgi:hypothetical protein